MRAFVLKLLRETGNARIAEAYSEHSRAASSLLWRIRVADPALLAAGSNGQPWDRRRLLESFRSAGIARDPAGVAAREVERRLVALGQERVSPALIHALAMRWSCHRDAFDTPQLLVDARRLAFSHPPMHVPHYDALLAEQVTLPSDGPALGGALVAGGSFCRDLSRRWRARGISLSLEPFPTYAGVTIQTRRLLLCAIRCCRT